MTLLVLLSGKQAMPHVGRVLSPHLVQHARARAHFYCSMVCVRVRTHHCNYETAA